MIRTPQKTVEVIGNRMVGHHLYMKVVQLDRLCTSVIVTFRQEPRPAFDRATLCPTTCRETNRAAATCTYTSRGQE